MLHTPPQLRKSSPRYLYECTFAWYPQRLEAPAHPPPRTYLPQDKHFSTTLQISAPFSTFRHPDRSSQSPHHSTTPALPCQSPHHIGHVKPTTPSPLPRQPPHHPAASPGHITPATSPRIGSPVRLQAVLLFCLHLVNFFQDDTTGLAPPDLQYIDNQLIIKQLPPNPIVFKRVWG